MNFRRLQALRAVIESGSVTEAAGLMNLTQSGVSRLIAALEDDVGFAIFERRRGRLQITARGEAFFREVEPLLAGIDQLAPIAEEIRTDRFARLRLVALNSQMHGLVPLALTRFSRAHPTAAVTLTMRSRRELIHWTAGQQFDLGLAALPVEQPALHVEPFIGFPVVVALPPGHRLADRAGVPVGDLAGEPLISLDPFGLFEPGVRGRFLSAGVEPRVKFETTSMLLAGQLVAQGLGIAMIDPFVANTLRPHGIEIRPLVPALTYEYGLIWPAGRSRSPLALSFAACAAEVAETLAAPWRL